MFGIGPLELVMILVVALLVFGPKRVPELARTVGKGLAEFRRASNDLRQSLALDEIQQDLRRDLGHNQTIHRPPTNADADAENPDAEKSDTKKKDEASASGDAPTSEGDGTAPAAKHQGELPLGNDHEHHDEVAESESETASTSDASTPSDANPSADPDLGSVPVSEAESSESRRG